MSSKVLSKKDANEIFNYLDFIPIEGKKSVRSITINNLMDCFVAFKIKVSVHHIFVIKNSEGFLPPYATIEIKVVMRPLNEIKDMVKLLKK